MIEQLTKRRNGSVACQQQIWAGLWLAGETMRDAEDISCMIRAGFCGTFSRSTEGVYAALQRTPAVL